MIYDSLKLFNKCNRKKCISIVDSQLFNLSNLKYQLLTLNVAKIISYVPNKILDSLHYFYMNDFLHDNLILESNITELIQQNRRFI